MKLTELRCSACNGTLKVDENNPHVAECEYCHARYTIEWDQPGKIQYQPIRVQEDMTTPDPTWKVALRCAVAGAVVVVALIAVNVFTGRLPKKDTPDSSLPTMRSPAVAAAVQAGEEAGEAGLTGLLADFAEQVFDMPAETVTGKELGKIKWLSFKTTIDFRSIGYSFDDPQENQEAELTWVDFSRDDTRDADLSCLPAFTGLKRVDGVYSLSPDETEGLALTAITGYYDSLEEVAASVEDPSLITYLDLSGDPFSLAGLEKFPNLKTFKLSTDSLEEAKTLVNAKSLRSVYIDMYEGSMDFSVFGMMPWLESLGISSASLRDFGFISQMDALQSLYLEDGTMISLAPLADRPELTELTIDSCDEVKDMSAVSSLVNLKKLYLELPYGCPQPDLGSLSAVTELYLDGFDGTSFLRGMGNLETLTLDGCSDSKASDFDGLSKLKTLRCTAFTATARDYGFVTHLPALEELNLSGTATYEDISGIFNMPTLKRLNINNMQCEINFDRIAENTTLEALSINHIKLYKNVNVSGGGGIVYVDWDDVSFTENLSFLGKLKGLKELTICENELTDLAFAESLAALRSIDFADNYVTDLSPLSGLKSLSRVVCTENPISNYEILGDSVMIIK